ncbi:tetratricopeptide repeat protein [Hankyongella ginsenosidimutans]|uniref:Tetratricopeptide repeat protein n=1 Tax=Hankyongella ginsenosidimutans TaxID=1763828 RepID=A0A4D7C8B5_9SPHN|nr:tetratricopeptide repeat protein [Hankyongella ginsenosidimutans]QCI79688.1 tetratricopeptide repeat protein [Hankyongella ginsenosidimutans]
MASNNYGDAVRVYNRIIGLLPDNVNARVLLARAQAANKQIADARATYQRALTIKGQQLAPVLIDLVNFEANQGNYSVALGYANQLRKEYPNQNVADMTIGNIYMGQGFRQSGCILRDREEGEVRPAGGGAPEPGLSGPTSRTKASLSCANGWPRTRTMSSSASAWRISTWPTSAMTPL